MKANDLREALNILDPERPLETEEDLRDYFVERPMSPRDDLSILLPDTRRPQKILFTGHRGSGKSTELAKLSWELKDRFFIVRYSVKSVLNLFDLTYVDVLLSMGLEVFKKATEQKMKINEELLAHVLDFTTEITKEVEIGVKVGAEVSGALNVLVAKLTGKLSTEDATRTTVREKVSHRLSDLLENIDLIAREVERETKRRVLVIVEDLDKTDLDTAKTLFYGHASSLLAPPVSIIYTFPNALRHDNDFIQIEQSFPNTYVLPNLKVHSRDGKPDGEGLARLQEILTRRVKEDLFTADALSQLAALSGGIPRELVSLARLACLEARKADKPQVDSEAVDQAARRRRIDYQVLLTTAQLELLGRIHQTKKVENLAEHRALLHNLSALEYQNRDVWYDVHPIVEPLLAESG